MESITTIPDWIFCIASMIRFTFVSARIWQCSPLMPRRCARIFICDALSSPEMYNNFSEGSSAICNKSVDLPAPGSPAIRMTDPGTAPPPSTLDSSGSRKCTRISVSMLISESNTGIDLSASSRSAFFPDCLVVMTSSTRVSHSLHCVHLPIHLE